MSTALILGGLKRTQRQAEPKIIMLADYGQYKDRSSKRTRHPTVTKRV